MTTINKRYQTLLYKAGQVIGMTAGSITALLWTAALWLPNASFSFHAASVAVVIFMTILAVFAIVASLKGHVAVLMIIFAASFFPIGIYVLGIPYWIHWVGLANIGYLFAAVMIWRFRPPSVSNRPDSALPE